ncbi:MAG: PIN domain-containing protein [Polyangiaceae bacterium]
MKRIVYDAGVLIAADKNHRDCWARHRVRLAQGLVPLVPSEVIAQASRSSRQAQLRRFLRGCEIVSLDEQGAHRAGEILALSRTSDVIDAIVVELAIRAEANILTSDAGDLSRLVAATHATVLVSSL